MTQALKRDFNDLDVHNKSEIERKISELVDETWLSRREAEISILMNETDEYDSLAQLAKDLELSENTLYTIAHDISRKIGKSRRTLDSVQKV